MKLAAIPLFLGLGGDREYWNDKRTNMLSAYLRISTDANGEIPKPTDANGNVSIPALNKQTAIWKARASGHLSIPAPKTQL